MLYVLIPHTAQTWEHFRMFASYTAVEQTALHVARERAANHQDPDWCFIIGYDAGIDEYHPMFVYTILDPTRLGRERLPTPSS